MSAAATRESTSLSFFSPTKENDDVIFKTLTKSTSTDTLTLGNKISSAAVVGGALLYYVGMLHPVTAIGVITIGALSFKESKSLYDEKVHAISDEIIKSGLNVPVRCEQGPQLTIITYDNPTGLLNEALDEKIQKLALELLDIKDGEAIYKRNETTIGLVFQFKMPIDKSK